MNSEGVNSLFMIIEFIKVKKGLGDIRRGICGECIPQKYPGAFYIEVLLKAYDQYSILSSTWH